MVLVAAAAVATFAGEIGELPGVEVGEGGHSCFSPINPKIGAQSRVQ